MDEVKYCFLIVFHWTDLVGSRDAIASKNQIFYNNEGFQMHGWNPDLNVIYLHQYF